MFKKIRAKLKQLQQVRPPLDVSHFNDPLAEKIDWFPLKGGGTNIKTHKLNKEGFNRYFFKATLSALLFSGVFVIAGIAFPLIFILNSGQPLLSWETFGLICFGLICFGLLFAGVGSFIGYRYLRPIVFDKSVGYFWKGWKVPQMYGRDNPKGDIRLSEVYAFQILAEYIRSDKSSYYSYELNLIMEDGSRHNVIDHGKLNDLRSDAADLASFLGKPVWDLTDPTHR